MAIVTKTIKYVISGKTRWVSVDYDNEIVEVIPDNHLTKLNFVNGYGINDENANVEFWKFNKGDWYNTGTLSTNETVTELVVDSTGNSDYTSFKIDLNMSTTQEYTIDLTESNLYNPNAEPEPEPEPEPEIVNIKIPSLMGENNYKDLMESGFITVKIDGQEVSYDSSTPVTKYGEFTIEIINHQLFQEFDYDNIDFNFRVGDKFIKHEPDVMTADKMVFNVNSENWDVVIGKFPVSPNLFVYLNFKYAENDTTESYPFLNIYKIDDDSLNTLATEVNERRNKKDYDINGNVIKDYDVSGYISELVRVPYKIVTDPFEVPINLNNETMKSQGYEISDYIQEISLGKIKCNHETLVDIGYKNIEFKLFVPNFKPISLEVPKVIDRIIEMKLYLDVTTGRGTLNLLIDGIAFHVEQEKITKDIPFKSDSLNVRLNDDVLNTKYLNPYLEISVLSPDNAINSHELTQRKIQKSSLLYAQSDKILLTSNATYNEQLEIEMLLRKGVYVNG